MKIEKDSQEWRKLTFEQRTSSAGIDLWEVPELSKQFRENVWKAVEASISNACCVSPEVFPASSVSISASFNETLDGKFWGKLISNVSESIFIDTFLGIGNIDPVYVTGLDRRHRTCDQPAGQVVGELEIMFQTPGMPKNLAKKIEKELECSPYRLDVSAEPAIIVFSAASTE